MNSPYERNAELTQWTLNHYSEIAPLPVIYIGMILGPVESAHNILLIPEQKENSTNQKLRNKTGRTPDLVKI
jgi:hypothetical protein